MVTQRSSHAIQVVLNNEQGRGLPQGAQVERFVEFTFRHCAFPKEADGDVRLVLHLVGQGDAHCQGQVAAHNGVAAKEAVGLIEQVHRAATTAGAAVHLPIHFRHDQSALTPRARACPCSR